MNKKMKQYLYLLVAFSVAMVQLRASEGNQVLYSINMPGNPFQQPYYQIMIKKDVANALRVFSSSSAPQLATITNPLIGDQWANNSSFPAETNSMNPQTFATTDYVAAYADPGTGPVQRVTPGSLGALIYGITPYTVKGYTEGASSTLYLQRPAQVQLPFTPQGGNPVTATFPDYVDVFSAYSSADAYKSLHCGGKTPCGFTSNATQQLPSWYTYCPVLCTFSPNGGHCGNVACTSGLSLISYTSLASLTSAGNTTMLIPQIATALAYKDPSCAGGMFGIWYPIVNPSVPLDVNTNAVNLLARSSWLNRVFYNNQDGWFAAYNVLSFAPVLSPGYDSAGFAAQEGTAINTVLATGDLAGNYSSSTNPYLSSATFTYDGASCPSGMSYFQLFAQNLQWFSNQKGSSTVRRLLPGQGPFSDALQIAAMEAVPSSTQMLSQPIFNGSLGTNSEGIAGPLLATGTMTVGSQTVTYSLPEAFLSKITTANFISGTYLQKPSSSQQTATNVWNGGLVASIYEDPFEYYGGLMEPYLPLYFADPGRPVDQVDQRGNLVGDRPGWNYCSEADFSAGMNGQTLFNPQMYYSQETNAPMTNFLEALSGTR